jgi:hypothetical protein
MEEDTAWITYPVGKLKVSSGNGKLSLEDSYYCLEFGKNIPNTALAYTLTGIDI